jgi:hypothetical protein
MTRFMCSCMYHFPGSAKALKARAKFCYDITTVSTQHATSSLPPPVSGGPPWHGRSHQPRQPRREAQLLPRFLLLRLWKDTLAVLHFTRRSAPLCEELGLTSGCVDAVVVMPSSPPALQPPPPCLGVALMGARCHRASTCSSTAWWPSNLHSTDAVHEKRPSTTLSRRTCLTPAKLYQRTLTH